MPELVVEAPLWKGIDDFTIYRRPEELRDRLPRKWDAPGSPGSVEIPVTVRNNGSSLRGRALVCSCRGKELVSLSIRLLAKHSDDTPSANTGTNHGEMLSRFEQGVRDQGSNGLNKLRNELYRVIFSRDSDKRVSRAPSGLLVIAGRTGSAKSKVARGLIAKLLSDLLRSQQPTDRRPHLITLEDPIEVPYYQDRDPCKILTDDAPRPVDYTPRDLSRGDAASLDQALKDALRQTPTVVYVGEVRGAPDWRAVLGFAGTGHLVVVTTHSGSISEAFATIFEASEARSPAERGFVARKVLGIVHQKPLRVVATDNSLKDRSALIPAVWRRTEAGVAALVTDGLSSILPHYPPGEVLPSDTSSLGRRWFVTKLYKDEWRELEQVAFADDLAGC